MIAGTLAATLPDPAYLLTLTATADYVHALALVASLPDPVYPLALIGTGVQDLMLPDTDGPRLRGFIAQGQPTATGRTVTQQAMQATRTAAELFATTADPIRVGWDVLHTHGLRTQRGVQTPHAHGLPLGQGSTLAQAESLRVQRPLAERYAHGLSLRPGARLFAADTIRTRTSRTIREQHGEQAGIRLIVGQQQSLISARRLQVRWTHADKPLPGRWWPFYIVPGLNVPVILQSPYTPRPLHCRVALSWTWIAQPYCVGLDPDPPYIVVPVQEVYVVINSFSLVRADTSQPVDALDFSASLDADSWGWSWSATVPASQMSRVRSPALGEFVELIATLNGTALRLVVERLSRSRQFGQAALKISGRARAAWLAEPHSPIITVMNTETRTAQQLLNEALMVNGVSIGWTVDWQLEDWSVPAGLWSYTGTYLGAAQRLAESGGGYVQADHALQTLHIRPYYPVAPWDWAEATPDLALPEDVCTVEEIEWQDKPAYNAVWVVGGANGRRDQVKRTGTAGDVLAPTVVDPLACDTVMTRQRGLRVIADTGRQVHLSLKLPVLAATGLIRPGLLLEYTEQGQTHVGLSRAVSVNYQFPTAWQTIKVETHEL
ncbi:MAG TPA: hypothetical protein PLC99_22380 [Verrucomicrobiota bacterium]|nr:hypothetical protein [Verrucomicrobiota bacterium]